MSLTAAELEKFEASSKLQHESGLSRVLAHPVRMPYSKLMELASRWTKRSVGMRARTFWGDRMDVMFPDTVSLRVYRYGFFEEELTRTLITHLKPGMTFFDVGSHFGFFSLLASKLVGPAGHVVAFEPTPSTFQMLGRNLRGHANARGENVAAYRENTTLTFHDFGMGLSVFNSIYGGKLSTRERMTPPKELKVQARTLDSWCLEHGLEPDLLKIDTEGAELDVLEGMSQLLARKRPMVTLEVGDINSAADIRPSRAVVEAMLAKGYRALEFVNGKFVEHRLLERYPYTNILFLPK